MKSVSVSFWLGCFSLLLHLIKQPQHYKQKQSQQQTHRAHIWKSRSENWPIEYFVLVVLYAVHTLLPKPYIELMGRHLGHKSNTNEIPSINSSSFFLIDFFVLCTIRFFPRLQLINSKMRVSINITLIHHWLRSLAYFSLHFPSTFCRCYFSYGFISSSFSFKKDLVCSV